MCVFFDLLETETLLDALTERPEQLDYPEGLVRVLGHLLQLGDEQDFAPSQLHHILAILLSLAKDPPVLFLGFLLVEAGR